MMRYSDLGEAQILKPAKSTVKTRSDYAPAPAPTWVSLGEALSGYLQMQPDCYQKNQIAE